MFFHYTKQKNLADERQGFFHINFDNQTTSIIKIQYFNLLLFK